MIIGQNKDGLGKDDHGKDNFLIIAKSKCVAKSKRKNHKKTSLFVDTKYIKMNFFLR